jgi:subtilisin family serine protease
MLTFRLRKQAIVLILTTFVILLCLSFPQSFADPPFPLFKPGEVICRIVPGGNIDSVSVAHAIEVLDDLVGQDIFLLQVPEGVTVVEMLEELSQDTVISFCEPNYFMEAPEVLNHQWLEANQVSQAFLDGASPIEYFGQPSNLQIHLAEAHQYSTGAGIKVAVIDAGICYDHPALSGRIAPEGYDFVDNDSDPTDEGEGDGWGHGCFVSGIVALVAPDCQILPLRVLNAEGRGTSFNVAKAIIYATDQGAKVVNLSLGMTRLSQAVLLAVAWASRNGVLSVASAGNDNAQQPPQFPASDVNVMGVAAVDQNDIKADFSNCGWYVEVSAPGVKIFSILPDSQYGTWSGTSFASAFVSGTAVLLFSFDPQATPNEIEEALKSGALDIDNLNPTYRNRFGEGRIDALGAIQSLSGGE